MLMRYVVQNQPESESSLKKVHPERQDENARTFRKVSSLSINVALKPSRELTSGPGIDRTRGWWDATVVTIQEAE